MAKKKIAKSVKKKRGSAKKAGSVAGSGRRAKSAGGARKKTSKKAASAAKGQNAGEKKSVKTTRKSAASSGKTKKTTAPEKRTAAQPKTAARKAPPRAARSTAKRPPKPRNVTAAALVAVSPLRTTARKLSPKDIAQFRELLLEKRAELAGDVMTLQNEALNKNRQDAAGDLSSMPIHMADLGSDNYEKEFTLGLIEGEREILRQIDAALSRIKDGTYGICEATGRPISKARLKARPWAKYCYEYVLAQESGRYAGA